MRFSFISLGLLALSLPAVFAQDDSKSTSDSDTDSGSGSSSDSDSDTESKPIGKSANTDTTDIAGTYAFTYFYNLTKPNNPSTRLACSNSTGFSLTFPEGANSDIGAEFPDGEDPVYHTKIGRGWPVLEYTNSTQGNTLKFEVYIEDRYQTSACWLVKKNPDKSLMININPQKASSCPTRFVPSTAVCTSANNFLIGVCTGGACKGEPTKKVETKGKDGKSSDSTKKDSDSSSGSLSLGTSGFALTLFGFIASLVL